MEIWTNVAEQNENNDNENTTCQNLQPEQLLEDSLEP